MKTAETQAQFDENRQTGASLINNALLGAGMTTGAAALYHLLSAAKTADPSVLSTRLSTGAIPTKKKKRLGRAAPSAATAYLLNTYKHASHGSPLAHFQALIGGLVPKKLHVLGVPLAPAGAAHEAWKTLAGLGAAGLGAYGGLQLVNSVTDEKRKDDLQDAVSDARKEYFEALTGRNKEAAVDLDKAVANYWSLVSPKLDKSVGNYIVAPTLAAAIGSGLIGGTYMYKNTKSRTRAENLRRAAAARARLDSLQQTPWVDPADLAALTKNR